MADITGINASIGTPDTVSKGDDRNPVGAGLAAVNDFVAAYNFAEKPINDFIEKKIEEFNNRDLPVIKKGYLA